MCFKSGKCNFHSSPSSFSYYSLFFSLPLPLPCHSFPLFPSLFLSFFLTLTLFFHLSFPFSFTLLLLVSFRSLTFSRLRIFREHEKCVIFPLPHYFHLSLFFSPSSPLFSSLLFLPSFPQASFFTVKYVSNSWEMHNLSLFLSQISSL